MKSFPIAILTGGLATRLRPTTETIPKALLSVAGRPFIEWQLMYLKTQGIRDVVMCVGYLGEMIRDLVGTGDRFGQNIQYSFDGPKLLGTGGAIKKALPFLGDSFFVLYGDSYLPIDFRSVQKAFLECKKPILVTVYKNKNQWDRSNIEFSSGHILNYNKQNPDTRMSFIDYGLGVLSASLFVKYPLHQPFDLGNMYNELSFKKQLAGLEVNERFYEIGSRRGLEETHKFLLQRGVQ